MDRKKNKFVYFATASVNMMTMVCAVGYAWTSPSIPKLNGSVDPQNNPLSKPTTILEDSWITALQSLGATVGPLFSSVAANRYGRKRTLILFSIPMVVSNVILIFAKRVWHFLVARFLIGVGTGCVFTVIPLYVAEISEIENRGFTSMVLSLMNSSMQCVVYIIGPYVTISSLAIISLIPSVLFLSFVFFVPESPYYFVIISNTEKAEKSLAKFREKPISSGCVQKELFDITRNVEQTKAEKASLKDLIQSKIVRKSLIMSLSLMFSQQFSGILAILPYLQTIFGATNSSISPEVSAMTVGLVQFITVAVTSRIIDRVGRKTLIMLSSTGVLFSLCILGVYFYLQTKIDIEVISWLPIVSILVYIICYNIGLGPLPWTIMGEIFPSNLKTYLNGIATFANLFCAFLISMFFPTLSQVFGMAWSMWFFAICTTASLIFIYCCLPETRGKSFLEIQLMLRDGRTK